jgi:hypothetical protein
MNQFYPRTRIAVFALSGLFCSMSLAHADMGPSFGPRGDVKITVHFEGARPEGDFRTVLLSPVSPGASNDLKPDKEPIPGLDRRLNAESGVDQWIYCRGYSGPDMVTGTAVHFRRVTSGDYSGFPRRIRLAVYFPLQEKLFLTAPIETSRRDANNQFLAELTADGTGTLSHSPNVNWIEEYDVLPMAAALAVTLIIELSIVALWMAFTKKRATIARVLLVAFVGNLVTDPLVWLAALAGKVYFDLNAAALIYSLAEIAAFLVEGLLYAWFGQLRIASAMLLAFTARFCEPRLNRRSIREPGGLCPPLPASPGPRWPWRRNRAPGC